MADATQLQLRRGTTVQTSTFTGAVGEVTVDTTRKALVVHDGATAGGVPAAKLAEVELVANKSIDGALAANSDTLYPSQKAVKTYADTKEVLVNKSIDGTLAANSDTLYPSQKAVKTYANTKEPLLGFTAENVANKDTDVALAADSNTKYASQKATKAYADTKAPAQSPLAARATGVAYTLTAVNAKIDFGTTDPSLTITAAGTWAINGVIKIDVTGATFAANQTVTLLVRRTNNTAANIASTTSTFTLPIMTLATQTVAFIPVNEVFYTTALANDVLELWADVSALPAVGSITVEAAYITAVRVA